MPEEFTARAVWIEAGDDTFAIDALVQLKDFLKESGLHDFPDTIEVEDPGQYLDEDKDEPTEGDYIIDPHGDLYQHENYRDGCLFQATDDHLDTWRFIFEHCKSEQFWPDVWRQDDHGGIEIYTADEYPRPSELYPGEEDA